ncbi:peptidoglycan D,D-transpeptidase FtsI family protein [Brevibacillus fulvus]|uniref:Cell division protein FtsI/penicillin-binding protein 2 n=1 Tax=Brevibacillus fulvus TaxID=1125967 RepID=A0A939BP26_9BACL|nr:penicillin-binding transpeptidase domain-containing protein [Brevibacillus fulvus]MBM7589950.1 cell division protein FtsI/penicillin-binding protein 2 [Brevibacillus fulvus]
MNLVRQIKRRSFVVLLFLTLVWSGLAARLWWIQLGAPHNFSKHHIDLVKNAVKQRQQSIMLNSGRGDILDQKGRSFTGKEEQALIIFPLARGSLEGTDMLDKVAQIVQQPAAEISRIVHEGKTPMMLRDQQGNIIPLSDEQAERINALQIPGIVALEVTERYRSDEVAKHVVGFVNQNPQLVQSVYQQELEAGKMSLDSLVGASGLEHSFDRFLQGVQPSILSYYVDGQGNPLRGLDIRLTEQTNQFYPLSLITTLDKDIQRSMEDVADQAQLNEGAIVVLDATTGDVLSMVSRPNFDPNHVNLAEGAWQNHAVKQLAPGSVFKTIVAAAALAEGVVSPGEHFLCEGEYGKYGFSCWKKGGHGSITIDEAFAESCNVVFAQIANRLGADKIEEYAKRLGLGTQVGHLTAQFYKLENFRQIDGEEKGEIFAPQTSRTDEGVLIQTAIGQRDVRVTPLQAANMMVTILRGGQPGQVRLVSDIAYRNGMNFYHFSPQMLPQEGIDTATSLKLKKMLREVVTEGTGSYLQQAAWPVAGKSGTAEVEQNGVARNHHWFVGYAPEDHPKYAIAVVAENQPVSAVNRGPELFARVIDALAALSDKSPSPRSANP